MAQKAQRRQFTDSYKRKMVARVQAGMTIGEAGDKFDISHSVIRGWARNPQFGGKEDAFTRGANGPKRYAIKRIDNLGKSQLPTVEKLQARKRAKAAIPVEWHCPHCGEAITFGGEA